MAMLLLTIGCERSNVAEEADPLADTSRVEALQEESDTAAAAGDTVSAAEDTAAAAEQGTTSDTSIWTAGIVQKEASDSEPAVLQAVREAQHEGFDRVVFEFQEHLPGYYLEYVDRPVRQCGSGHGVSLAGDGWLEVRLRPARAHTSDGEPTVTERERELQLTLLRELQLTCDFEADVTWVLGLSAPNRYRVSELSDPPRLIVDVQH